jgi:hypothetical protein
MDKDFFDIFRYNYSIDRALPKELASKVQLALDLAEVQSEFLEYLGYEKIAPVSDDRDVWFYQKDGKFGTLGSSSGSTYRKLSHLYGDILLCLNNDGYHFCKPSGEDDSHYFKVEDGRYYFLWANDEFTELKYISLTSFHYCKDEFEYIKGDNYVAIKYYKKKEYADGLMSESERLSERPRKDLIISRTKAICHIEVFVFFYKDKIVVEKEDEVIVYDSDFEVLYESYSNFEIWETNSTTYMIFPYEATVIDLTDFKKIKLKSNSDQKWYFAKTFKHILICYDEKHFPVQRVQRTYYYDDDSDWDDDYYEPEETPVRNTFGHVFDSSFKLLREFNVIGEIEQLKEMGDTIVMVVNSSSIEDNDTNAYYNVNAPNLTRHNNKTDEDFSVPDITFRDMVGFDSEQLVIVKTRVPASDYINLSESTKSQLFKEKCGVYYCVDWRKGIYKKKIECKYDYIKSLPIEEDHNIYYAGVFGLGDDNVFDLYVNHKIVLQGIPFNRGNSVNLIEDGTFIQVTNTDGKKGIIRNGKFVLDPIYKKIRTFVQHERDYDPETNITSETLKYLFAVSNDELYGICSPSGKLILPMNYSTIDMDDELCIVLVRDFNAECDDENDETLEDMLDYGGIYEIGFYDEEKNVIVTERARFKDGKVFLDDEGDYVWDGGFRYLKEDDNSGWTDQELRDAADMAYEGHSRLELGLED